MTNDTLYVTADTHFNHKGIIDYCDRPYGSVVEMNEAIIEAWNSVVPTNGDVWFLGDFGFDQRGHGATTQPLDAIFDRLAGHKHLVKGNHDESNPGVLALGWESIADFATLRRDGIRAIACHYPLTPWKHAYRGYLMLHGHCHGTLRQHQGGRLDVGWDVHGRPLTLHQAAEKAGTYLPVDHHAPR
ncbi:MAG: metallophosphoesterase [candidate division NC10 bacterium]